MLISGNIPMWICPKILSVGRSQIWNSPSYRGLMDISGNMTEQRNILIFTLGTDIRVKKEFYKMAKSQALNFPLRFESEVKGLGKSSVTFEDCLTDISTGRVLSEELDSYVYASLKTRKPVSHNIEFNKEAMDQLTSFKTIRFPKLVLPQTPVFSHSIMATHSDTDLNQHTNRNVYQRHAANTGACAAMSGFYTYFKGDLANYRMKRMITYFRGESVPGEVLEIFTWEDEQDKLKLYFKIMRGYVDICDVIVMFYSLTESKM